MKSPKHFLSVVVPIFQQEKTIIEDIYHIISTLDQIRYDYEIIAVVDGTTSDRSFKRLKKIKSRRLVVTGYLRNQGKGYALKFGMKLAKGDYVAFIDSGMDIDPNGISMVLEHMEWYRADAIVASKRHPASQIIYPTHRRIISLAAQIYSRLFLGIKVTDTQAGLKIFRRQMLRRVLPRLLIKSFAFDLEILAVANHLGYKRIYEAPVKINYDFSGSHLQNKLLLNLYRSGVDALAIFYRLRILRYYDR